ncbi:maleylpyruvate isomerase family mycothiol-dependent enzyme [Nocardia bhagyanarayanae]|uniref:Uncharacterized protein (TIGR03083 family) n=1 Tax=Nocardia bhagyanarayanae TaxID=1215925 RepID=A0A543F9V4_9NOCA|nr:maleylpyruvate isomerase family mycothiol-dependent enzyme [Nocardia bhagyanarayanae]TQM30616.1 uncharacterized protein (TIGR03083 family) [Nocardia bhagyanarayanae]
MTTTTFPAPAGMRRSALDRATAMRLAATEYTRVHDAAAELGAEDWSKPTDCTEWTVHQMISHVVGMAAMAASPRENLRQNRIANKRPNGEARMIDALTGLQVREFGTRSPEELVAMLAELGPRAAKTRRRTPALLRALPMPGTQVVNGYAEKWSFGYLLDVILTRDPWMHRVDLARATGREFTTTAEHDGVLVDDVVHEWAQRHGRPYRLTLTGPAGGAWTNGEAEPLELDAIEFCRTLSGRADGTGLLATEVPF